jgi:hypothetical protein
VNLLRPGNCRDFAHRIPSNCVLVVVLHGEQEQGMKKTLYAFGMASLLLTGVSGRGIAAGDDSLGSQHVTETQMGSQQVGRPATGPTGTVNSYGVNRTRSTMGETNGTVGMQSNPDATHPTAPQPNGGGAGGNDSGGSGGAGSGGASR